MKPFLRLHFAENGCRQTRRPFPHIIKCCCLLLAVLLTVLPLAGCGEEEAVFLAAVSTLPDTLDPQLANSNVERTLAINLFEGLFRLGPDGSVENAACEHYTVSGDGLCWNFTLRPDACYNDGDEKTAPTPLRAGDFVYALRRVFALGSACPYRETFRDILGAADIMEGTAGLTALGVRAVSDTVLEIRLAVPDGDLPRKLCCAGAMPCQPDFFASTDGTYGLTPKELLSNGAFRISLWSEEQGVTLRRIVPQDGLVNKVRLIRSELPAPQRLAEGVTTGEFLFGVPDETGPEVFSIRSCLLLFNCTLAQFAQPQIRAGLAGVLYACLPQQMPEGYATAGGLLPESLTLGDVSWRQTAGNLLNETLPEDPAEEYRAGLQALGHNKLSGVTVLVPDTETWHTLYDAIALGWQQQLSAFFSVQFLPEEELLERVADGDYQLAFCTYGCQQDDIAKELDAFLNGRIPTGYRDEQVKAMLQTALTAGTPQDYRTTLRQAELLLLGSWSAAPLYTVSEYYAVADGFSGVGANPFGQILDFTYAAYAAPD